MAILPGVALGRLLGPSGTLLQIAEEFITFRPKSIDDLHALHEKAACHLKRGGPANEVLPPAAAGPW